MAGLALYHHARHTSLPNMRAHQRYAAVINVTIFILTLSFILFLNLGKPSGNTSFAWHTVRYQSASNISTSYRGACQGLSVAGKPALVVSHVAADGDVGWLQSLSQRWRLCIYDVDESGSPWDGLHVPTNRGHEAMAYLTFMIDNYDHIPEAGAVFVHGNRFAWHNDSPDYDNAALLAALNISAALYPNGYHNLRCDWSASTCNPSDAPAQGSLETTLKSKLQPWDARAVSDAALSESLVALFGNGVKKDIALGRADAVRSQCCAQFVVSRTRIQQHSRAEYVAIRQWLLDGSGAHGASGHTVLNDDQVAGRILSYVWHILFMGGDGATNLKQLNVKACPAAQECYCRLYGRCDLENCRPGRCPGQYSIPPGYRLPAQSASTHDHLV